jgi:site-specific DNA recombinase
MAEQVDGHSLDAQRTSTADFIAQRRWTLGGEYVDAGISAKSNSHRPALTRLLEDARDRRFDVVVVDKVDRFYRHLKGLLTALEVLDATGVTFVSVKENLDFTTPWGKLALTVLGMLAEIYVDNLSQETHKGKLARARKGLWNGRIPVGYCDGRCSECTDPNGSDYCPNVGQPDRSDAGTLIEHPIEGEAVRRAFRWYLTGHYSDGTLAEKLSASGLSLPDGRYVPFRTKGLPGRFPPRPFGKESVRAMLQRRFYTGVVVYYGVDERGRKRKRGDFQALFPGKHPALVSVEDFERVQALRRQFSCRTRRGNSRPNIYPLSGLLICDSCGRTMRASRSGRRRYYRDTTRIEHSGHCDQPTLKAKDIEQQVLDLVCSLKLPPDWENLVRSKMLSPKQQTEIASREHELEERWARVTELYLEGLLSREQFQEERWKRQTDRADLHPREITAIINAGKVLEDLPKQLSQTMDWVEKNELLRLALVGVRIKGLLLTAVHLGLPFYTLFHCLSGSDGRRPT